MRSDSVPQKRLLRYCIFLIISSAVIFVVSAFSDNDSFLSLALISIILAALIISVTHPKLIVPAIIITFLTNIFLQDHIGLFPDGGPISIFSWFAPIIPMIGWYFLIDFIENRKPKE